MLDMADFAKKEDYIRGINPVAGKSYNKVEIELPAGKDLFPVVGGYILCDSRLRVKGAIRPPRGKICVGIPLNFGERLHFLQYITYQRPRGTSTDKPATGYQNFESWKADHQDLADGSYQVNIAGKTGVIQVSSGFVVRPAGEPLVTARGAATMIGCSNMWVLTLTRRGPFSALGGLQGYINDPSGVGFIPKAGNGMSGDVIRYYESDIRAWIAAYGAPPEASNERYLSIEVPAGLRALICSIAEPMKARDGYVTRTHVFQEVRRRAASMSPEEYAALGLDKPINDRHYEYITAVAEQDAWPNSPIRKRNTGAYRRRGRRLDTED